MTTPAPSRPRTCYYIPPNQCDDEGFIPSLVTENEPAHVPFMGNGACASPWHWGHTYEQARDHAAKMNWEDFGLNQDEVAAIMISAIRTARRAGKTFLA